MSMALSASRRDRGDEIDAKGAAVRDRSGVRIWALAALIACVALFAFGPMATAQAAGTASIEGTVTAVKGGNLEGIQVTASGASGFQSATTAPGGTYKMTGLTGGTYRITFSDPSATYLPQETSRAVAEAEAATVNASLKHSSSISGKVTSAATGTGLPNATVSVSSLFGVESFATTDASGAYTITGLSSGSYIVEFSSGGGYVAQRLSTSVNENTVEVNAALREAAKISGTVTDATTHAGLAKINVLAFSSTTGFGASATTDASGGYTLTGLPTGSYKVVFSWEFSEAENKAFENAPRFIPKYITQYYSNQPSAATANLVGAAEGAVTPNVNVAMVPSAPVNTALPVVSGTPTVGSPLSCSSGSWTGESELKLVAGWPLTSPFGYQWIRDGVTPLVGAVADTYVLQAADIGHGMVCEVSATNGAGHASARSLSFAVVKPVPVVRTSASKLKVVKGVTKVAVACLNAPCAGSVKAIQTTVTKHRRGNRKVVRKVTTTLGSGSYSLTAGQSGTITLRLTSAGKRKLATAAGHRVSSKLIVTVAGGTSVERTVQLSGR